MGGCVGSPNSETKITLKLLVTRLKTSIPIEKSKIERKLAKDETILIESFQSDKKLRSKGVQQTILEQVVFMRNMLTSTYFLIIHIVWGTTQNCCTKIIDYSAVLQNPQTKDHIKNQIQMLLFLKTILMNKSLDDICDMIVQKYNISEPTKVGNEIVDYHKNSIRPNEHMCNQYVMNLCTNEKLELAKINQVGHNFRYGV